ncbi:MAG: uroporphyrinogen decarboxylase family protein [Armatimonadota bacterium]
MTSREIIRRVVDFTGPERIGFTFSPYQGEPRMNDFQGGPLAPDPNYQREEFHDDRGMLCWFDEWGNKWGKVNPDHSGEVVEGAISDWSELDDFELPPLDDPTRYEKAAEIFADNPDMYCTGSLPGCAFNIARKLRRIDNFLADCALYPDHVKELNTRINDLMIRMCELWAEAGAQGIRYCEDWGTQDSLMINPSMWKDLFLFTFERLFGRCQELGLDVWMHSCGYVEDIMDPLIGAGVAAFQFDQPAVYGIEHLGEKFGGRVVFHCPVDIQTVLQTQDKEIIQAEARRMRYVLGGFDGGFVAKDYPSYRALGITEEEQQWAYEAWLEVMYYD